MAMNRFAYARASTVEEALDVLDDRTRPLAGGTDLLAVIKDGLAAPERLVDLKGIPGLGAVRAGEGALSLGAAVRLAALLAHPAIAQDRRLACLYEALLHTASPQLRHMATLGGNLLQRPRCWYFRNAGTHCLRKHGRQCFAFRGESKYHAILGGGPCYIVHPSDPAAALLALEASVAVQGQDGARAVHMDEFFLLPRQDAHREADLGPGELVIAVSIPTPAPGARGAYVKVSDRQAWDFALVSAAVQIAFDGGTVSSARVVLGGVAPVPWRAQSAEEALLGRTLDEETIALAAAASTDGARPLAQNGFKVELARGVVRQALEQVRERRA